MPNETFCCASAAQRWSASVRSLPACRRWERIILPLSGSLHLFYEGHGEKKLEPFEQDRFDGGWKTVSVGRATDFNVMLREGTQAQVRLLDVNPNEQASVEVAANGLTAVFAAQGTAVVDGKSVAGARTGGRKGRRKLPSDRRQRRMQIAVRRGSILTRKKRAGMSFFLLTNDTILYIIYYNMKNKER